MLACDKPLDPVNVETMRTKNIKCSEMFLPSRPRALARPPVRFLEYRYVPHTSGAALSEIIALAGALRGPFTTSSSRACRSYLRIMVMGRDTR